MTISGQTNITPQIDSNGYGEVNEHPPSIIPITEIKTRERFQKFLQIYEEQFGRIDFCRTCPDSVRIAVNKLNKKFGY